MSKEKAEDMASDLLIDERYSPILIESECQELAPVMKGFLKTYSENKDAPVEEWLTEKMEKELPEKKPEEIRGMVKEIVTTLEEDEENLKSLHKAVENGRSKESWLASKVKENTSAMSMEETVKYLNSLDEAVKNANEALYQTITTRAGTISQNPRLEGFIAEQYHAQSFNMNAEAVGSEYRARVLEPDGTGYSKNSVDLVIEDGVGKVVKRFQSKYCANAQAMEQAFANGDYRGQQKLVPDEQLSQIQKKATSVIVAPDGTSSNPLTKREAVGMRDKAQSGNWEGDELGWNEYKTQNLALGIGKQVGFAAVQGAAVGIGFECAQRVWNGEEIESDEVIEAAVTSGADFGVKAATAGALKVGVEKEIISVIPKGTPAGTIANVAFVAVENAKVMGKVIDGEYTVREGIDKIEQTTVSTVAGLKAGAEGAALGAAVGAVAGPVGAAVGGFIGGTIGYVAGSKVGEAVVKGAQAVRDGAKKVVESAWEGVKSAGSAVADVVGGIFCGIGSFFGF